MISMMEAFGIACLLTYAINAWAAHDARPRYADAVGVSVLFCVSYALSNLLTELYGFPHGIVPWPFIDLFLLCMVARAWYKGPTAWKATLAFLLIVQLTAHVALFYILESGHATNGQVYIYAVMMNYTFGLQLLTVGSVGICHAVRVIFGNVSHRGRPNCVENV